MAQFFAMLFISFRLQDMFRVIPRRSAASGVGFALLSLLAAPTAFGQTAGNQAQTSQGSPTKDDQDTGQIRFRLPTVTVTAQKESDDIQDVPVSVTAVTGETLESAGVTSVSEAAQYAPNTFFNEFTARKLSNPRFRGIGASPANPGVTTFVDGVPQFNANSSSFELLDIDQIEFIRGPQGALYGRNTVGGLVNITSRRPSLKNWTGQLTGPFGNIGYGAIQGTASGPVVTDKLGVGVGIGYSRRDGYTVNDVTGNDLDSRSAVFSKVQALWTPAPGWDVRGILSTERARDGDYALYDLGSLRANPYHASHNFEGFTHRNLVTPTFLVSRTGKAVDFSSTTGWVWWKTEDSTDLDYTPLPLIIRDNNEKDLQFTQEFRFASAKNVSVALADNLALKWQAGAFFFTQNYEQLAVNTYSPGVLPFGPFPVDEHSPEAQLDDHGIGIYGRATMTFNRSLDAIVGLRGDFETKKAVMSSYFVPLLAFRTVVDTERDFNDVSPQFTVAYHATQRTTLYGTAARGFKAGGFNPASPPGTEAYDQEHSWNYEGGAKTSWLAERLVFNAAAFFIDWNDLQVNVPNPQVAAQFYIANAGNATSKGFEVELSALPRRDLDIFGGFGYTNARFGDGSVSGGVNVSGNKIAGTPDFTGNAGVQYSRPVRSSTTAFGRAEIVVYGSRQFDDANTQEQGAYSIVNFRGGVRGAHVFVEGWLRNTFDTFYVPVAFPYDPRLAQSGFIGESGAPRTFGVRAGVTF
jgi:iron complex outermembrane recepter protein